MSRLIVKNLPKTITETKFHEIFSKCGTVTDVQLKYTADGKFRKFGFIGFQNEETATAALEKLNNTFIATSKITVEKCALLGDANKPRAWSKYSADSSAFKKNHKTDTHKELKVEEALDEPQTEKNKDKTLEKYKDDPDFEDFLQVHGKVDELEKLKQKSESEAENDDDNQQQEADDSTESKSRGKFQLFTLKLKNLPFQIKKKEIREFFRPYVPFSIRIPRRIHGLVYVGFKTEIGFKKALLKNKSFIKGKQIFIMQHDGMSGSNNSEDKETKKPKWKRQEEALKFEEEIGESGMIFIRNLSYTVTEKDVEEIFTKYGLLSEINIPIDPITRKIKGFGVVTFMLPEHAAKAYSELDGTIFQGRMLHLLPGKSQNSTNEDEQQETGTNFKSKKSLKQTKPNASGSYGNWNALFLGANAVADTIANRTNMSKSEVVGLSDVPAGAAVSGSAAVRLALGETELVAETRKYLEEQGIVLDVFNFEPKSRSNRTILVKNLPADTKEEEMREIFGKFGLLDRVVFPPHGIAAIIQFADPSEARKAYTKLAYSQFKYVPLLLQWAPENTFSSNVIKNDDKVEKANNKDAEKTRKVDENKKDIIEANNNCNVEDVVVKPEKQEVEEDEEEEPEADSLLFVKNLSFKTTDVEFKKHFDRCGKIKYASIVTKKDKNNPGGKLSMGYGFVQFYHKKSADKALKDMQQSVLNGKSLELKRSERTTAQDEEKSKRKSSKATKQTGSKILVKNLPFEANQKEVKELFGTFGEIKALRLPKKMGDSMNSHRGFAFVDYTNATDAKVAFDALCQSTHLYGRRLVLEWAATEEAVEDIRKRTADHFSTEAPTKKSKKSVFRIN